ncbi:MAG TPA: aspartate kinase [Ignavibacteria bacterium]|nr:aspartate kinase [Ignavibacteria bacterium]
MKVLKFGGTSIGTADRMKNVASLINNGEEKIVILSAMSGTTNMLYKISEELENKESQNANKFVDQLEENYRKVVQELFTSPEFNNRGLELIKYHFNYIRSFMIDIFTIKEKRTILAQGELISSVLFYNYLLENNMESKLIPALNFMRIDNNLEPDNYYIKENLNRELKQYPDCKTFITQGYICRNMFGEIENLKRGGSDYSASIIGRAINAEEIQIWTDVSGFYSGDPRYVNNAKPLPRLSFDEAAELAYFGAKILHPSSVLPAKLANIQVRLKNTLKPGDPGTLITSKSFGKGIKATAAKDGITAIKIKSGRMLLAYGFIRKVFEVFERYKTSIDMTTTSEIAVSITIDDKTYLKGIVNDLQLYGNVEVNENMTIVCVVGDNILEQKGYINKVFDALENFSIRMISYGGSRHNISILINSEDKKEALIALNNLI